MPIRQYDIIKRDGVVTRETSTTPFEIKVDGQLYTPALITLNEIETNGNVSRVEDQCGHTERNKQGTSGWTVNVEGVVTANDGRAGNLSVQFLRDTVAHMDSVNVVSDIFSGQVEMSNVVITDPHDMEFIRTPSTDGKEKAFDFTMTLGESESE